MHAEAFGQAQEHDLLEPMIEGTRKNMSAIGEKKDVFKKAQLTAGAGFASEANMRLVAKQDIDAYIADTRFRQRDPHFNNVEKYKARSRKERAQKTGGIGIFIEKPLRVTIYCICQCSLLMGSKTVNKVGPCSFDSTVMEPLCIRMMFSAVVSPRPTPCPTGLVV